MKTGKVNLWILVVLVLMLSNCAQQASLRSFTDPSLHSSSINSVAIFPVRNTCILPGESREMSRSFTRAFVQVNRSVNILNTAEATNRLNENDMAEKYSNFLRDYAVSGIPNVKTLKEIGTALGVDAILQGEIFELSKKDGYYPGVMAVTSLTLRYSLLSTSNGDVLWEATSSASIKPSGLTVSVWSPPPPIIDAIQLAQSRILSDLPKLGQ